MNIVRRDRCQSRLVVFSDLDQTLLDGRDYSHDRAVAGLALLKEQHIPLVLCTSKTRPEVEFHRRELGNHHPFIIENGGAIYIPVDYFDFEFDYHHRVDDFLVVELGTPYPELVRALSELRKKSGLALLGFSDMTTEEVAGHCGLSLHQAAMAKQREYDEPFLAPAPDAMAAVIDAASVPVTQGGRFFHLATSDKGRAASRLLALFRRADSKVVSIGIGDAFNDMALLKAVDVPVLVQDCDGGYDPEMSLPGLRYADGIGPAGWNAAITNLVNEAATGLVQ